MKTRHTWLLFCILLFITTSYLHGEKDPDFLSTKDITALEKMIEKGVNLNMVNENGTTKLMMAVLSGETAIVQMLIEAGADVNVKRTSDGSTALHFAASRGRAASVQLLLKAGTDPNMKDKSGETPLMEAVAYSRPHVVYLLLANGAIAEFDTLIKEAQKRLQQAEKKGKDEDILPARAVMRLLEKARK